MTITPLPAPARDLFAISSDLEGALGRLQGLAAIMDCMASTAPVDPDAFTYLGHRLGEHAAEIEAAWKQLHAAATRDA
jgi:hypothetical protein